MNEYAFSGRIVYQRTHTVPIDNGYLRRTVVYIDVGRPAPVMPTDAPLVKEAYQGDPTVGVLWGKLTARERRRVERTERKQAQIQEDVTDHIKRHGLSDIKALCETAGVSRGVMISHLKERLGTVYRTVGDRKERQAYRLGLVGVDYE